MLARSVLLSVSAFAIMMIGAAPAHRAPDAAAITAPILVGRFGERVRQAAPVLEAPKTTTAIVEVLRRNATIYVDWRILRAPRNLVFCGIAHARVDATGRLVWIATDGWGNRGTGSLVRRGGGYDLELRLDGAPSDADPDVVDFYRTYRLAPSGLGPLNG